MSDLVSFLRESSFKLGLYSSPTGTGKTLSLICSVLSHYLNPNLKSSIKTKTLTKDVDDWEALFSNPTQPKEIGKRRTF